MTELGVIAGLAPLGSATAADCGNNTVVKFDRWCVCCVFNFWGEFEVSSAWILVTFNAAVYC